MYILQKTQITKYKFTDEDLKAALASVKSGSTVLSASRFHRVPRTTLTRKLKEGHDKMLKRGRPKTFTDEEESQMLKWASVCAERGTPRSSVKKILDIPSLQRSNPFKNNLPSRKWSSEFMSKYKGTLRLRTPEALSKASAAVRGEDLVKWWAYMDDYFSRNGLREILSDPSRIFNADETYFAFNPSPKKVIVPTGGQSYVAQISGNKTGATVLHTVCIVNQI